MKIYCLPCCCSLWICDVVYSSSVWPLGLVPTEFHLFFLRLFSFFFSLHIFVLVLYFCILFFYAPKKHILSFFTSAVSKTLNRHSSRTNYCSPILYTIPFSHQNNDNDLAQWGLFTYLHAISLSVLAILYWNVTGNRI